VNRPGQPAAKAFGVKDEGQTECDQRTSRRCAIEVGLAVQRKNRDNNLGGVVEAATG
jgi:hypothetical protein